MKNKTAEALFFVLLTFNLLVIGMNIQTARASGTIYIRYDGSIDPPTAPILRDGNLYTFTADIYDSIQIERPDVTVDGNNFKLQGAGAGSGFSTVLAGGLTIQDTVVTGFSYGINTADCKLIKNNVIRGNSVGIYTWGSSLSISNNVITDNSYGIQLAGMPSVSVNVSNNVLTHNGRAIHGNPQRCIFSNNTITNNQGGISGNHWASNKIIDNNLSNNTDYAIQLWSSVSNIISGNIMGYNNVGVNLTEVAPDGSSTSNTLTGNVFAHNNVGVWMGFRLEETYGNFFYHNDFINNVQQVYSPSFNYWDGGYPLGGNFWTGYNGDDVYNGPYQNLTGSDGIGDTPYIIDENDRDNYPFMTPYNTTDFLALRIAATIGGTTNPPPAIYAYAPGTTVDTTAVPNAEYLFDYWNLDGLNVGSTNPISVTMDTNHVLQAVFRTRPDIAVTSVSSYPNMVRQGQVVNIYVTVQNQWTSTDTFDVIVYADKDRNVIGDEIIIGIQTVYDLAPRSTQTLTFEWNTTTMPLGSYYISARALVQGDRDPADNLLTAKKRVSIKR